MGKLVDSETTGMRVMKWSNKRQDNAVRVRNNQRRHRENARNYVKDLEARLADSQVKLQEALKEIERLHSESSLAPHLSSHRLDGGKCCACGGRNLTQGEVSHSNEDERNMQSVEINRYVSDDLQQQTTQLSANPVLSEASAVSSYYAYDERLENEADHSTRPPGEEDCTTLCREAYMIISQQNYAGIEESVIYQWLEPGFRAPSAKQAGCRVDNQTLFRLLDYISSSRYT